MKRRGTALSLVLCGLAGWALFGSAFAQVSETIFPGAHTVNYFDKDAPTVLAEEVTEYWEREGVDAQERRNAEREDAANKETTKRQNECFANPALTKAGDTREAQKPIRKDLEGKTLLELVQLQQQRPDPQIEEAIRQRAKADAAKAGMPGGASALQALPGTIRPQDSPIDAGVGESMRRQQMAASPAMQACLAAAEVKFQREELKPNSFDDGAFRGAIYALREAKGRIASVVVQNGYVFRGDDLRTLHAPQRFNVVLRGSERARFALPLKQAEPASFRPNRGKWPDLNDGQKLAETAAPSEQATPKKKPTVDGFLKSAKDLVDQLKAVPR